MSRRGPMRREDARKLLDAVRDGSEQHCADRIRMALVLTGDLNDEREGEALRIVRRVGTWEKKQQNTVIRRAEPFDWLVAA